MKMSPADIFMTALTLDYEYRANPQARNKSELFPCMQPIREMSIEEIRAVYARIPVPESVKNKMVCGYAKKQRDRKRARKS